MGRWPGQTPNNSRSLGRPPNALFLVYYAPWYQPLILPSRVIVYPDPKTRACNENQVLILSPYSLVWCHPLIYVVWD